MGIEELINEWKMGQDQNLNKECEDFWELKENEYKHTQTYGTE